jgi:hypothetical protein
MRRGEPDPRERNFVAPELRRGGVISALVAQLERDCKRADNTLRQIAGALDAGAGAPYEGELTPEQAQEIAATLATVGVRGGAILARDLERTAAREGGA